MKELLVEECLSLKGQIAEIKCKLKLIEREVLENKIPKDQVQSKLDNITKDFSVILARIDCIDKIYKV
jgi:uncharacterized protein YfkK (UPF0435 family)